MAGRSDAFAGGQDVARGDVASAAPRQAPATPAAPSASPVKDSTPAPAPETYDATRGDVRIWTPAELSEKFRQQEANKAGRPATVKGPPKVESAAAQIARTGKEVKPSKDLASDLERHLHNLGAHVTSAKGSSYISGLPEQHPVKLLLGEVQRRLESAHTTIYGKSAAKRNIDTEQTMTMSQRPLDTFSNASTSAEDLPIKVLAGSHAENKNIARQRLVSAAKDIHEANLMLHEGYMKSATATADGDGTPPVPHSGPNSTGHNLDIATAQAKQYALKKSKPRKQVTIAGKKFRTDLGVNIPGASINVEDVKNVNVRPGRDMKAELLPRPDEAGISEEEKKSRQDAIDEAGKRQGAGGVPQTAIDKVLKQPVPTRIYKKKRDKLGDEAPAVQYEAPKRNDAGELVQPKENINPAAETPGSGVNSQGITSPTEPTRVVLKGSARENKPVTPSREEMVDAGIRVKAKRDEAKAEKKLAKHREEQYQKRTAKAKNPEAGTVISSPAIGSTAANRKRINDAKKAQGK